MTRILLAIVFFFFVLSEDTRSAAYRLFSMAYSDVVEETIPRPLERPSFSGPAHLIDCLRGTGHPESHDTFAAFCTDLSTFAAPPAAPSRLATLLTSEDLSLAQSVDIAAEVVTLVAQVEASVRPGCFDKSGRVASWDANRIWTKAPPGALSEPNGTAKRHATSYVVPVPYGCMLRSPAAGRIVYAAPFQGYLGVVIIETETAERLTLAGLGNIAVARGDSIQHDTELGTMPDMAAPALEDGVDTGQAALLYFADKTTGPPGT
ncbi:MAG: hypothetical protein Q7V31_02495 [Parvibaculum sp.]|uniref:hypothetical protein n=1 Tax=Parvibaculum sp. TaxID=2024848 RepID=UPI00271CFEB7|nr:hypothetical protein [Parvibaculum sp.]MDO8837770.1 hypothetical protein [Parvibaculum sp.]